MLTSIESDAKRCNELFYSSGFKFYSSVGNKNLLEIKLHHISETADDSKITSFIVLVNEIKNNKIHSLPILALNFVTLLHIILCITLASTSAK